MHTTTQQLGRPTNPRQQRGRWASTSARALARNATVLGREVLGSLQVIVNHSLLHVDQNVRLGRLPWVWPPGSNHDVGQAQHYTQSLCNNHPFAFIAYCLVRALLLGCPFIYVSSSFNHKCIKKLQFVRYC